MNLIEDSFNQHQWWLLLFFCSSTKSYQKSATGVSISKYVHFYPQLSLKSPFLWVLLRPWYCWAELIRRELLTKDESDFTGNITGSYNVVLGYKACFTNPTSMTGNVILGTEAMQEGVENSYNVVVGHNAARDAAEGNKGIIIGSHCCRSVSNIENVFAVANQSGLSFLSGVMGLPQDDGNYLVPVRKPSST